MTGLLMMKAALPLYGMLVGLLFVSMRPMEADIQFEEAQAIEAPLLLEEDGKVRGVPAEDEFEEVEEVIPTEPAE